MKPIKNKTQAMLEIEKKYNKPIEEVLRYYTVDEGLTYRKLSSVLGIYRGTALIWLKQAGIYSKKLDINL